MIRASQAGSGGGGGGGEADLSISISGSPFVPDGGINVSTASASVGGGVTPYGPYSWSVISGDASLGDQGQSVAVYSVSGDPSVLQCTVTDNAGTEATSEPTEIGA